MFLNFRSIFYAALFGFLSFALPCFAISYSIISFSENAVLLHYSLDKYDFDCNNKNQTFLFAFSSQPLTDFTVDISSQENANKTVIPITIKQQGWYSKSYLQWISYSLTTSTKTTSLHGEIAIHFSSPIISTKDKPRIKNNILTFSALQPAAKKLSVNPFLVQPFSRGLRMYVDKNGIYRIAGEDLKAKKIPIETIPSRYYKIYCNQVEIPMYITNNQRQFLANDDEILFYGNSLKGTTTYLSQFSNSNAYWLTWEKDRPGIRYSEASGAKRKDATVYQGVIAKNITARDFLDTIHLEEDNDIRWLGSINVAREMADSTETDDVDNWYWGLIGQNALTNVSIQVPPPTLSTSPTMTARLHIRFEGLSSDPAIKPDHKLYIYLNDNPIGNKQQTAEWDGQTPFDFISEPFPSHDLNPGLNKLTFNKIAPGQSVNDATPADLSALNWIEIEYYRSFSALDDATLIHNNSADTNGIYQFMINGFNSPNIDLWDISTHRILSGFELAKQAYKNSSSYSVIFQDSLNSVHEFYVQSIDKRLTPLTIVLDTLRSEWESVANADYIIVTVDSFFNDFKPFVDVYKKKGFSVAVVDIADVYNSFSNGIRDPESIRSMLRFIFSMPSAKPPKYLLLGGDTSHDLDKNRRNLNIIPTHLSRVPGWGASSDDGYFATIIGDDNFPDLFVGRFPAQNRSDLKNIVDKTVKYITGQVPGPWHDNLLLVGGAEPDFTTFNNDVSKQIIGPLMNMYRLDADPTSRYYCDEATASKSIAGYINSGIYALNFNGHGGGNVWSDSRFFSYSDLGKLYNGQWDNGGRLPFVFSFTCLTGFFESAFYPSLGEEFIRLQKHGAIGFWGASAYTSKRGNIIMNRYFLDKALHDKFESIGELLAQSKMDMLVRFGGEFLPLIREYNFLGDPALPWVLAPDSLKLTLDNNVMTKKDTIAISGTCLPVKNGQVKIAVGTNDQKWNDYLWKVPNGSFSGSCVIKDNLQTSRGIIRAFAWNDSVEVRGWTSFAKSNLLFNNLVISPSKPSFGDSILVSTKIDIQDSASSINALYCLFATNSVSVTEPKFDGVLMTKDSTDTWTTNARIPITFHGIVGEELLIKFRAIGKGFADSTDTYAYPIKGRPDLLFTGTGLALSWKNDSLFIQCEVINAGNETCSPFSVALFSDTIQSQNNLYTFFVTDSLKPGKTKNLSLCISDINNTLKITGVIDPQGVLQEINRENNISILQTTIRYQDIQSQTDTLFSPRHGLAIVPTSPFPIKRRVFLFTDSIKAIRPLLTESAWISLQGDSITSFRIGVRPLLGAADSLSWIFYKPDTIGTLKKESKTISGKTVVSMFDPILNTWRFSADAITSGLQSIMHSQQNGPFALSGYSDMRPPQIRMSVYGREMMFLDYAAKGKPFNILFSDASGIIPSSISIFLNNRTIDSNLVSQIPVPLDLREISCTAYPPKQNSIDSLRVLAQDLAGNKTTKVFAYMPGEDLTIKYFSCHPNPFTAKQDNNGNILQQIRFAFLLTDVAREATITIYTIGNRVVWTWQKTDGIIGYQEVPWDGKTNSGYRLANGTYYAKLTAKNDSKKVTTIIRIAKLEGY